MVVRLREERKFFVPGVETGLQIDRLSGRAKQPAAASWHTFPPPPPPTRAGDRTTSSLHINSNLACSFFSHFAQDSPHKRPDFHSLFPRNVKY